MKKERMRKGGWFHSTFSPFRFYKHIKITLQNRPVDDFRKWKYKALEKRDECSDGKITVEEYIAWMESCFPNRTPKT